MELRVDGLLNVHGNSMHEFERSMTATMQVHRMFRMQPYNISVFVYYCDLALKNTFGAAVKATYQLAICVPKRPTHVTTELEAVFAAFGYPVESANMYAI